MIQQLNVSQSGKTTNATSRTLYHLVLLLVQFLSETNSPNTRINACDRVGHKRRSWKMGSMQKYNSGFMYMKVRPLLIRTVSVPGLQQVRFCCLGVVRRLIQICHLKFECYVHLPMSPASIHASISQMLTLLRITGETGPHPKQGNTWECRPG